MNDYTKLQFWQARSSSSTEDGRYTTEADCTLSAHFDVEQEAQQIYERVLMLPKADLERNKSQILLELARSRDTSKNFPYESQKLLYQIKAHPATREHYARCCEYLHRFYTEKQPLNMKYEEWVKRRLTEKKGLSLRRLALWMAWANRSFPTPLSPVMIILLSLCAMTSAWRRQCCILADWPIIREKE